MAPLLTVFPSATDLLTLEPEELAGVVVEYIPFISQNGHFGIHSLMDPLFQPHITGGYPRSHWRKVELAFAEALNWLGTQGLLIVDPGQPSLWYVPTRRCQTLKTRADVEVYRKGRILPVDLLQPILVEKVWPLFLRGDHEIAIFQAFKVVEVAVRNAANVKGAGYPDDLVGKTLMRKAFKPDDGPLTDMTMVVAEKEAVANLFDGAIGHAKNPTSHRDVEPSPQMAARLIVFASHLLDIVELRST